MTRGAALLVLALAACGGPAAPPDDRPFVVVKDATGADVRVRRPVRRIVTTVPGLTETVIALGLASSLVAVSEADTGIPEVASLPRLRVFPGIQAEALAQHSPDLVLVDPTLSPRDVEPLRARFAVFASDSKGLDSLRRTLVLLGEALDRRAEAQRLVDDLDDARKHAGPGIVFTSNGHPLSEGRVLLLAEAEPLLVLGPGSLLDDMIQECGFQNVAVNLGLPSGAMSSERIRERAPDWILVAGGTFPDSLKERWASAPAVKDGHVADATANDLVRAGPRTANALRRLAKVLHGLLPPEALGKEDK